MENGTVPISTPSPFPQVENGTVPISTFPLMFYGPSGVGKTETAKFLSEILGGQLLYKQFSMFQNNEF